MTRLMSKKILTALTLIIASITTPAYGFELSNELKAGAVYLVKISIGVVISSIIIAIGLWIYSRVQNKKHQNNPDSGANKFRCEIDDTTSMDDAIITFLNINNN